MQVFQLSASPRVNLGKKATKALRAEGLIPVVLNGGAIVELPYSGKLEDRESLLFVALLAFLDKDRKSRRKIKTALPISCSCSQEAQGSAVSSFCFSDIPSIFLSFFLPFSILQIYLFYFTTLTRSTPLIARSFSIVSWVGAVSRSSNV